MKIRASLFALVVFSCLSFGRALQDQAQDHFLPPDCGGGTRVVPAPIRVTMETLQRHRIGGVLPWYPLAAKKQQIQAVVVLRVEVNKEGNVSQVQALGGPAALTKAAVRAVSKWKYRPVVVEGDALVVSGEVLLTFRTGKRPSVFEGGTWPFRAVACTIEGVLLHRVEPEYPQVARVAHVAGDVIVKILIDKEGRVAEATVVRGHPLLEESALNAVRQWRYQPYVLGSGPIPVEGEVTLRFHM
jgi:TonB family protein